MPQTFEPLLLRHRDAQAAIAVGPSFYWRLVKIGKITVVGRRKAGRAVWSSVKAYAAELEAEKAAEAKTGEAA
jgi:hypothetical protein